MTPDAAPSAWDGKTFRGGSDAQVRTEQLSGEDSALMNFEHDMAISVRTVMASLCRQPPKSQTLTRASVLSLHLIPPHRPWVGR